jgi:hypothetical protein
MLDWSRTTVRREERWVEVKTPRGRKKGEDRIGYYATERGRDKKVGRGSRGEMRGVEAFM